MMCQGVMPIEGLRPSSRSVRLWLSHYRVIWPADVLRRQGHDVVIMPPNQKTGFLAKVGTRGDGSQALTSVTIPEDADVIVLQRPAHPLQPQMIQMMRQNGIAVVVDMDDDMSSLHPLNIAYETYRPRSNTPFNWNHAAESCKQATYVTTSTRQLQRVYAKHGRGEVIDNYIPAACLDVVKEETGFFGWAGTTKSHPNDLQVTGGMIQKLIDEGFPFKVVGGKSSVKAAARLREEVDATGSVPLNVWVSTIAASIDVGLAPLDSTHFNTSKSRLKAIEYMAVGVPWVGSPREEYRRLHRESGCGLMADTPKQWYTHIKALMTDEVLRKEQAEMGRAYMQSQTYQQNAWKWMAAWETAYKMERSRVTQSS
jgi:glycosyltransferase involved in cell wall biosynthesis